MQEGDEASPPEMASELKDGWSQVILNGFTGEYLKLVGIVDHLDVGFCITAEDFE